VVFAFDDWAAFACLQCRVHEEWARQHASTMRNDLRYTPTSCFQTFPFPERWRESPELGSVAQAYYEFRAELMAQSQEGLTKLYNRFHSPEFQHDSQILRLHELHGAMDRAVLLAYGWSDISTACEYVPTMKTAVTPLITAVGTTVAAGPIAYVTRFSLAFSHLTSSEQGR